MSEVSKTYCDRCHKEIPYKRAFASIKRTTRVRFDRHDLSLFVETYEYDLCEECKDAALDFFNMSKVVSE